MLFFVCDFLCICSFCACRSVIFLFLIQYFLLGILLLDFVFHAWSSPPGHSNGCLYSALTPAFKHLLWLKCLMQVLHLRTFLWVSLYSMYHQYPCYIRFTWQFMTLINLWSVVMGLSWSNFSMLVKLEPSLFGVAKIMIIFSTNGSIMQAKNCHVLLEDMIMISEYWNKWERESSHFTYAFVILMRVAKPVSISIQICNVIIASECVCVQDHSLSLSMNT